MQTQTYRLYLYSALAIAALTLVWGFKFVPRAARATEAELRKSLEQELILLSSAANASTTAMKFRLLDVLKAEGGEHATRAFQDSPFNGAALLSWDDSQWKTLWQSGKSKEASALITVKEWAQQWPLAKLTEDEVFFARIGEIDGQAQFALVMPVRKANGVPMIGVGVFPANQFGLTFAADRTREVRVFDDKGFAVALSHPAYLGASLKREPLVAEMLDGDAVSVRQEWKSERGIPMVGTATRLPASNLFVAVETIVPSARPVLVNGWLYLILSALAAIVLNWFLFASLLKPLFAALAERDAAFERERRKVNELMSASSGVKITPKPSTANLPVVEPEPLIPAAELPGAEFLEAEVKEPGPRLGKIVDAALRSLDTRVRELNVNIDKIGLQNIELGTDVLQIQTAIEEVLKNALEAMASSPERRLTIHADAYGHRLMLTVEDTGCGVASEHVKNVFDPFFSTKDSEGVSRGLGLNVVRRVVEELDGTVSLENRRDRSGVRVRLEWPLESGAAVDVRVSAPPVPSQANSAASGVNWSSEQKPELSFVGDLMDAPEDEFSKVALNARAWPDVPVRKPKVRTLD